MSDELNAAARIVAIVVDSLVDIRRAPPGGRAASDALDYLDSQLQRHRQRWARSPLLPATETYILSLLEAAALPAIPNELLESGSRKESALLP